MAKISWVGIFIGLIITIVIIAISEMIGGIGKIIITWVAVFICIGAFLFFARNRLVKNYPQEAFPPTTPLPTELYESNNELDSLGFKCVGEVDFRTYRQWIYFSEDHTVVAYMTYITKPHIGFSSFLDDGLVVTIHYPHGTSNETGKIISHVVTTSISAAYDYQLYHTQQYISEHGEIKSFNDANKLLEWEQKQEYGEVIFGQVVKLVGRFAIALIMALVLGASMAIISTSIYTSLIVPDADNLPTIVIMIITILSLVLSFTWTFRPFIWPQTVEFRKKRKAKEA